MADDKHVVVGSGPTGTALARRLAGDGVSVRLISRSGEGPLIGGVTRVAADAADPAGLERHAAGASVLYNCANPASHRWETDWPLLAASLLRAAESTDAVLVTLSNLYGYGPPTEPMTPQTPLKARTRKGRVRAAMWLEAKHAHEQGRVRVTEARGQTSLALRLALTT